MNLNKALKKEFEAMPLKQILKQPVTALQGVSENDGKLLKEAFNVKTVEDLSNLKFARWAIAIAVLAETEE